MNLRNGKRYQPILVSSQNITYQLIDLEDENWSKSVIALFDKQLNYVKEINKFYENQIIYFPKHALIAEKKNFNEMVRLFREIYYLIDYYNVKTMPKFQKFILTARKKAESTIPTIDDILIHSGKTNKIRLTGQDRKAAEYLKQELLNFLHQ